MRRIALVGDYNSQVVAHLAIPRALELASNATGCEVEGEWIGTDQVSSPDVFAGCAGIWVVPASPYRNMAGALLAIRHAREKGLSFLGTCGGFQHAIIEFARDVAGLPAADHAESNAASPDLVVTPLACSLVEKSGEIIFSPGSRLAEIFGEAKADEGYHCSYGVNPSYRARLENAGLRFAGFDRAGEIRAAELPSHPFFIGTLFQPERSALRSEPHPLIQAFVRSVGDGKCDGV